MPDLPYKNCINGFIPGPDFPGQLLCMCHPEDGSIPSNDVYNIAQLMTIAENHGHSAPGSEAGKVTLSGYDTGGAPITGTHYLIEPPNRVVKEEGAIRLLEDVFIHHFATDYDVFSWFEYGHTEEEGRSETRFEVTCNAICAPVVYRKLRKAGFMPQKVDIHGTTDPAETPRYFPGGPSPEWIALNWND